MKERPILFNGEMVRAIFEGRKTQTRRPVKQETWRGCKEVIYGEAAKKLSCAQPAVTAYAGFDTGNNSLAYWPCPYGQPGDWLWVRETWSCMERKPKQGDEIMYRADGESLIWEPWSPSIHMPRWASRITLEITNVRVERLQDISEEDAIAEAMLGYGVSPADVTGRSIVITRFNHLWESINGKGSWDINPWVWVIEFKMITK